MATAMAETGEEAEKVQKTAEVENLPPKPVPAAQSAAAPTTKAEKLILQPQHLHPLGLLHPPRRPSFHRAPKYVHASLHGLQTKIIPMTRFDGMPMQKNSSPTTVHQMSTLPHRSQETMAIPDPPHSAENARDRTTTACPEKRWRPARQPVTGPSACAHGCSPHPSNAAAGIAVVT